MPEGIKKDHRGLVAVVEEIAEKQIYLRKGQKGGLYFFSPSGKHIYFMNGAKVRDLLDGRREFVVVGKALATEGQ